MLFAKTSVGLRILRAHADDAQPGAQNVAVQVAQGAGFARAAGREISRLEIKDQRTLTSQLGERACVSFMIGEREVGGRGAG